MNTLAFLTQHGKLAAVQVPLVLAGYEVFVVDGFDTDTLGTFTGETARVGSQLDAATTKAKLATQLSGSRYGLGSEGSFGPDPYVGVTAWAREVLAWWDAQEQRVVYAMVQGAQTNYAQINADSWEHAKRFAQEAGFPDHGIIIGKPGDANFLKNCGDWHTLELHIRSALSQGAVWLETDMRAHRNPTRMKLIADCAQRLAEVLQRMCPACKREGFGEETPIPGALCESCGLATNAMRAKSVRCNACGHTEVVQIQATVSAARCACCNP